MAHTYFNCLTSYVFLYVWVNPRLISLNFFVNTLFTMVIHHV